MKKVWFPFLAALSMSLPAVAGQPFKYKTPCYLNGAEDLCTVVETREDSGALKTRNIFSNRFGLTIKLRWNGQRFVTWDSFNKFEYNWDYKPNPDIQVDGVTGTLVMPGVTVVNVSWD